MRQKHGVLFVKPDSSEFRMLSLKDNASWQETTFDPIRAIPDLAEKALQQRITHLWIMASCGPYSAEGLINHDEWSYSPNVYAGRLLGVSTWQRGTGHLDIVFPYNTSWRNSGWIEEASPQEILIPIAYLENALGVTVTGSAASTGWSYLKKLHPEWIEEPDVNLGEMHFGTGSADVIVWQRKPTASELKAKYLHKWDKNMDFPSASTTVDIGRGVPVHVLHGQDSEHCKGHPQAAGVWYSTVHKGPPTWMSGGTTSEWKEGKSWLAGPIIRMLRASGHEVTVHEGYVFPERHDLLTKWGQDMWTFRNLFRASHNWKFPTCAKYAEKAIKKMAVSTVGITGFRGFEDSNEKKRPDIRGQVIAREREIMWHNINNIHTKNGLTPLMVYADAMYFPSNEPNGKKLLPHLEARADKLGGFKYEGYIEITPAVRAMFKQDMAVWQRLEFLNKIGWVKNG